MDVLDVAILALRLGLVVVLYAFVVLVLRFADRGLRATQASESLAAQASVKLRLLVVDPGSSPLRPGQIIDVADGSTLGRTPDADIVVADAAVSATHAQVSNAGYNWTISDLDSRNGTSVNDARITGPMPLEPGDVVALGGVRLQVVAREA